MPDRTHPNEHERSRPPTARRGSPLWLSVREPLARVDSVHLYFTHFTAWKRTPSSVTSASHRRQPSFLTGARCALVQRAARVASCDPLAQRHPRGGQDDD